MQSIFKRVSFCCIALAVSFGLFLITVNVASYYNINFVSELSLNQSLNPKILVDAGHGGVDGGAVATDDTLEKDLNLKIALKLENLLKFLGFDVVMIRQTDVSIHNDDAKTIRQKKISDLKNRLKLLDEGNCECLISVHMNMYSEEKYSGTQVFYGGKNEYSKILAEKIQTAVKYHLQQQNERVIKESTKSIYILYNAKKPAVMVECGFLSNNNELLKLKDDTYQLKMAFCIADGLIDYKFG